MFAIENEMSMDERKLERNRYWTNINGKRYLQVEEIDQNYFRDLIDDETAGDDNK